MSFLEPIFLALNAAEARYVVVGGLATVLHGFARLTAAIDLIVDLEPEAAERAIRVLISLGFRPRAPVDASLFSDATVRRAWIDDKGMRVFSLWDPNQPMCEVDLFVESPIPFHDLWERSELVAVTTTQIRIASISDLVFLKQIAGRAEDLTDIEALLAIQKKKSESGR